MIYTVITWHEDSRQIAAHHIDAENGQDALYKAAKEHGGELVVAIAGECKAATNASEEGVPGELMFPGEGLVEAQEYIELIEED